MDTIHTCSKCKSFYKIKETEDGNGFFVNGKAYGLCPKCANIFENMITNEEMEPRYADIFMGEKHICACLTSERIVKVQTTLPGGAIRSNFKKEFTLIEV